MTVLECDNGQLPSILVGDSVLLPVKIDITISGNFISAIQYFLSIPQSSHFLRQVLDMWTLSAGSCTIRCWLLTNLPGGFVRTWICPFVFRVGYRCKSLSRYYFTWWVLATSLRLMMLRLQLFGHLMVLIQNYYHTIDLNELFILRTL